MKLKVEVCCIEDINTRSDIISSSVEKYLKSNYAYLTCGTRIQSSSDDEVMQSNVLFLEICESDGLKVVDLNCCYLDIYVFHYHSFIKTGISSQEYALPNLEFHGLWDSLIFQDDIKMNLLNFASTAMLYSNMHVNQNIININRLILLHGPPGTGKTSLCKALAQKLSIRLSNEFSNCKLIEINAHSLFSKYFSESGKLVSLMFAQINELIDDSDTFVCVLMDEVESLTSSRKSVTAGLEPSDGLRAVNALLTQIDKLRFKKNVLVMATSNLTNCIDEAFLDRADIKQFIGNPEEEGCYYIIKECIIELVRCGIIKYTGKLLDWHELDICANHGPSHQLREICNSIKGISGRSLRKLPFVAHARFIKKQTCSLEEFMSSLYKITNNEIEMNSIQKLKI